MSMIKFEIREKYTFDELQTVEAETSEEAVKEFCRNNYDLISCALGDFEIPKIEVFVPAPSDDIQTWRCECGVDLEPFVVAKEIGVKDNEVGNEEKSGN